MAHFVGGGRQAAAAAVAGNGQRRNAIRSARSTVTYNEDILSEMSRPVYYDWKGYAHTASAVQPSDSSGRVPTGGSASDRCCDCFAKQ